MKPVSTLDAHLGYWLRLVSNHVSHRFQMKVERLGVTVAEWVVLRTLLEESALKPSEIAKRIGLTRGAVSKLLGRLEQKGLVVSEEDGVDQRVQRITLSPQGRRLVPRLADENDAECFGGMSPKEQARLLACLMQLVEQHAIQGAPLE
jgi:DNA-binding MarR family transcriptional regulator